MNDVNYLLIQVNRIMNFEGVRISEETRVYCLVKPVSEG